MRCIDGTRLWLRKDITVRLTRARDNEDGYAALQTRKRRPRRELERDAGCCRLVYNGNEKLYEITSLEDEYGAGYSSTY